MRVGNVCEGREGDGAWEVNVVVPFVGQKKKSIRGRRALFCNECTSLVD